MDEVIQPGSVRLMDATGLDPLFTSLRDAGFSVIGPTVRDSAIVLAELASAADLPFGWGVELAPGGYRLRSGGSTGPPASIPTSPISTAATSAPPPAAAIASGSPTS